MFPSNEHTYEVRYQLGELKYRHKDCVGGFDEYVAVVALDPAVKHSRFCAEVAVFAAEAQLELEGDRRPGQGSRSMDPGGGAAALNAWERRFVDACRRYADLFPGDQRVTAMLY